MFTGVETEFQVHELMAFAMLLAGYIPIILNYRDKQKTWIFAAYTSLVIGMAATNLEALFAPRILNYVEHFVGMMGAGILFAGCAYRSNKLFTETTSPEEEYKTQ